MYKRRRRNPYQSFELALKTFKSGRSSFPDIEMVNDCFQYWKATNKPLPSILMNWLKYDVERLLSGREGLMLRKRDAQSDHPDIINFKGLAVSYVLTCKNEHGYDENPIGTVCEKFKITRKTYYEWKKLCPDARDDIKRGQLQQLLEKSAELYLFLKES